MLLMAVRNDTSQSARQQLTESQTSCLLVVKVHLTGVLIKDNVLQHSAKLDGVPDLRLILPLQIDALGVAAALNVEDTIVSPAVLIISNQRPSRVCGQCGLACA